MQKHTAKLIILLLIILFMIPNFTYLSANTKESQHPLLSNSPGSEKSPTKFDPKTPSLDTQTTSASEPVQTPSPSTAGESTLPTISTTPTPTPTVSKYPVYTPNPQNSVIDPSKPMIALTFDDGPSSAVTNRILDVVEKYNIKVTFFVIGQNLDKSKANREALKRADALGCEIGNHTYDHKNFSKIDLAEIKRQIEKTETAIGNIISKSTNFVRPPYGAYNKNTLTDDISTPFILWSVDTEDWLSRNANTIRERVIGKIADGDIILMHDIYKTTAEAVETIIPQLIEEGYQFVTVSELFMYKNIPLKPHIGYRSPTKIKN